MSLRAMIWAFDQKVGSATAKLILLKIADNANDDGACWPSLRHIAEQTELSERAVRQNIKRLEDLGLMTVERRCREGVNLPNVYRLCLTEGAEPAPAAQNPQDSDTEHDAGVGQEVPPNLPVKPSIKPATRKTPPPPSATSRDPKAAAVVESFIALRSQLWPTESGLTAPLMTLDAEVAEHLKAGGTVEGICATVERGMRRMAELGQSAPRSLKAFGKSIPDDIAKARAKPPDPNAPRHGGFLPNDIRAEKLRDKPPEERARRLAMLDDADRAEVEGYLRQWAEEQPEQRRASA